MAAKKTTDEKTSEIPVKATAGAWWKTTVPEGGEQDVRIPEDVPAKAEPKEVQTPVSAQRPSDRDIMTGNDEQQANTSAEASLIEKPRRKRSPRKKAEAPELVVDEAQQPASKRPARRKKSVPQPDPEITEISDTQGVPLVSGDAAVQAPDPSLVEEQASVRKPTRKRPPRKKRPRNDQNVVAAPLNPSDEIAFDTTSGDEEQKEPVDVDFDAATAVAAESAVTSGEKKREGSGRRSRRGKRSQRRDENTGAESDVKAAAKGHEGAGREEAQERTHARSSAYSRVEGLDEENEEEGFSGFDDEEDDHFLSDEVPEPENVPKPVSKLLINAEEPEECRIALLEDGRLESIHVSTVNRAQTKNNIYKARIVAIEPNLQAAFVDYGTEKNGFLPFSEIHPEYFRQDLGKEVQKYIEAQNWKKLSITDVVEKGQEVLVQVVKEEVGKKGANMTTYLSLPGRCVVLMPGSDSSGISRKLSGEERRSQLREAMNSIEIPEGIGWIVRTASGDTTQEALSRDVTYLLRLWDEIKKKGQDLEGVGMVYEDQHSVLRFLREHFDPSIEEILVDDRTALEQVKAFIDLLPSKHRTVKVRLHKGSRPIFNQYSIEDQIESIYQSKVNLPSGGSIVIDPTEALVAIDVNSGSTSKGKNFEASIFQANMEAASEFARQLRLRDLGGLIVVDFIDMRSKKNIRDVERQVKLSMKRDKAKVDISRISKFGLMQISRQKLGAPIEAGNYRVCEHCKGRGMVRSVETLALFYLRRIQTGACRKNVAQVECHFPLDVAHYLLNNKRHELQDLEDRYHAEILITAETSMRPADNEIVFHKAEKEIVAKNQA